MGPGPQDSSSWLGLVFRMGVSHGLSQNLATPLRGLCAGPKKESPSTQPWNCFRSMKAPHAKAAAGRVVLSSAKGNKRTPSTGSPNPRCVEWVAVCQQLAINQNASRLLLFAMLQHSPIGVSALCLLVGTQAPLGASARAC